MATKGQIAFYMALTGGTDVSAIKDLGPDAASRLIGKLQAARGQKGALRLKSERPKAPKGDGKHRRGKWQG